MADSPFRDLGAALRALDALLSGGEPHPWDLSALRVVERNLNAQRHLEEYAPRTRRRYLAAAKHYETRPYRREYAARRSRTQHVHGVTVAQWERVRKLASENERLLKQNPQNYTLSFDDDVLEETLTVYGYKFTIEVLREQAQSIRAYARSDGLPGPHQKGNARFFGNNRTDRETRYARITKQGVIANTDFLYFYHGV